MRCPLDPWPPAGALRTGLLVVVAGFIAAGCRESTEASHPAPSATAIAAATTRSAPAALATSATAGPVADTAAAFTGREVCVGCHPGEAARWRGSHHDLAMQTAGASTLLGDFDDARFEKDGVVSRFFWRDGRPRVETDGPDGRLQEYTIGWTFGVDPLQQLLIELEGGRIQALGIAWDTRPRAEGGQRWLHLQGDEPVPASDALHWTAPAQRWNTACADCHSTGYRKGYDPATRHFDPSWSDIDVACEACHGAGSLHVERAQQDRLGEGSGLPVDLALPDRRRVLDEGRATRRIDSSADGRSQIEICGQCHASRAPIREGMHVGPSLLDSHRPALLTEPAYHADGQIRGEVYVYGSFLQSRMFAAGVVCSDCHDPHSLRLRAEGNALCAGCHEPVVYDMPTHTHHAARPDADAEITVPQNDAGPGCIDCHMPSRLYMSVDRRHDHSFRVPRPDLAETIDVPDACAACHGNREPGWSADAVRGWLGRDAAGLQQFAEVFHAVERRRLTSAEPLHALIRDAAQPAIVRATALDHLQSLPLTRAGVALATTALADPEAIVRLAALAPLSALAPLERVQWLVPLLEDPVRAVRIEAARMLAGVDPLALEPAARPRLRRTIAEYESAQRASLDQPHAHLALGNLAASRGRMEAAEHAYREALALEARFEPAWANLADLLARTGRESEAGTVLADGLAAIPRSAALAHALGLHRVRMGESIAALTPLAQAVERAPDEPRFRHVLALALEAAGRVDEARAALEETHRRAPSDAATLRSLLARSLEQGRIADARVQVRRLRRLQPDDPRLAELAGRLDTDRPGESALDQRP